ncbi:MAG: hypothetical protein AAFO02_25375 [Bacteroidota bacterium]
MKPNRSRCLLPAAVPLRLLLLPLLLGTALFGYSQVNLVPNHSFEDIDDCDLNFGSIPQAPPWQIVPEPVNSPDLFHYCSTSGVYQPPAGCNMIEPKEGEGMIAQAHLIPSEERVYVSLTDTLPLDKDIYISFSTITEAKCGIPPIFLCYTNSPAAGVTVSKARSAISVKVDNLLREAGPATASCGMRPSLLKYRTRRKSFPPRYVMEVALLP